MATPVWKGPGATGISFRPTTGKLTLGDRSILVDLYSGTKANCDAAILARGTFGTGARAGWVVTSSISEQSRGNEGTLTINWESGGASATIPLPTDEFSLQPMELYPQVQRHPAFYDGSGNFIINDRDFALVQQSAYGPTSYSRANAISTLKGLPAGTPSNAAVQMAGMLSKGNETFYLAGVRYTWTAYSYSLPTYSKGGFKQSPLGPLSTFLSGAGMSFVRLADGLDSAGVNGSSYKIVRTWLGGPNVGAGTASYWNNTLYP